MQRERFGLTYAIRRPTGFDVSLCRYVVRCPAAEPALPIVQRCSAIKCPH
jgi:hypothetical protein